MSTRTRPWPPPAATRRGHGGERRVAVVGRPPPVEEMRPRARARRGRGPRATCRAVAACPCVRRRRSDRRCPRCRPAAPACVPAAGRSRSRGRRPGRPPTGGAGSAAASMWPWDCQSGSKAGERQGMRVYSLRAGRMRSSQAASIWAASIGVPVPLTTRRARSRWPGTRSARPVCRASWTWCPRTAAPLCCCAGGGLACPGRCPTSR